MKILKKVSILKRYQSADILRHAPPAQRRAILRLAKQLKRKRIVHVNATAIGGGVAEIMNSFVPYLRAFDIRCDWYVINPKRVPKQFFVFTNKLHNTLQGIPTKFTPADWRRYHRINQLIADDLKNIPSDVLVINDPQPLLSGNLLPDSRPKIYVSHIDTSAAYTPVWKKILPMAKRYDAIVFSNRDFVHATVPKRKLHIFTPAIDPLTLKQKLVPTKRARRFLSRFKVPITGPLVVQVSRFDVWKNPLGVLQAHHFVKQAFPKTHTVFVGLKEAKDNPDADRVYRDLVRAAQEHLSVHFFFEPNGIKDIPEFTMMAQNAADVIIQNSTKEGFGLTVTEGMWKAKPVVGGPASGIRKQITDGKNGFIAKDSETLAKVIIQLLDHPKLRKRIGRSAKASVTKHYLLSRYMLDHLRLYRATIAKSGKGPR